MKIVEVKKDLHRLNWKVVVTNWTFSLPTGWVSVILLSKNDKNKSEAVAICEEGNLYAGDELYDVLNPNIGL